MCCCHGSYKCKTNGLPCFQLQNESGVVLSLLRRCWAKKVIIWTSLNVMFFLFFLHNFMKTTWNFIKGVETLWTVFQLYFTFPLKEKCLLFQGTPLITNLQYTHPVLETTVQNMLSLIETDKWKTLPRGSWLYRTSAEILLKSFWDLYYCSISVDQKGTCLFLALVHVVWLLH